MRDVINRVLGLVSSRSSQNRQGEPYFFNRLFSWANPQFTEIIAYPARNHAYAWGVLHGAHAAKAIGISRVSVIEFGVAGGNGLVALEEISEAVEGLTGVKIDVYGFDSGTGLTAIRDFRDKPYLHREHDFPMDEAKLRSRLKRAKLILGPVEATLSSFASSSPAPVAFISFDLDLYSSTTHALKILEADEKILLPRIWTFFDDLFACGDFDGERLAIAEFNSAHAMRKVSPVHGLRSFVPRRLAERVFWNKYHMAYIFDHSLYGRHENRVRRALDLT